MENRPVLINQEKAAEMISEGQIDWQVDVGCSMITRVRHPEHGPVLVHDSFMGGNYYLVLGSK